MSENNKMYTQEEVIAYAMWATDVMFNKSTIKSKDRSEVLATFKNVLNSLIEYDKKERRSVSVLKDIDNRK